MTGRTKSEQLFEAYCDSCGINCMRISADPSLGQKYPDYEIILKGKKIIVEVKQINSNAKEKQMSKDLHEKRSCRTYNKEPGRRVRKQIDSAYQQIKGRAEGKYPSILVIFDNSSPLFHTEHHDIGAAMYGHQAIVIGVSSNPNIPPKNLGSKFGKGRRMTPRTCRSISAIGVIREDYDNPPKISLYHNVHATVPLDQSLFLGIPIKQYTLPISDTESFQQWVEI